MNRAALRVSCWAAAAAIVIAAAFSHPFAANTDEALFVILARALRAGAFKVPGPLGWIVTDPWPGFPLLLALPEKILGSHWFLYRALGLAPWLFLAKATARLSRDDAALSAALLTALC